MNVKKPQAIFRLRDSWAQSGPNITVVTQPHLKESMGWDLAPSPPPCDTNVSRSQPAVQIFLSFKEQREGAAEKHKAESILAFIISLGTYN